MYAKYLRHWELEKNVGNKSHKSKFIENTRLHSDLSSCIPTSAVFFQFSVSLCHVWRKFSRSIQLCAELQTSINQSRSACKYIEAPAAMRLWEETRVPPAGRLTVLLSRTLGGSLCLCRGWGLGQAAVQWPGIGSASQFWAWHTADETGWRQSSTCMFGQLFAWTCPLKGEAPTPTEYWLLQDWETEGELCFADTLSWGGSGIFWRHFQLQREIVFHSKENLSGVDAVGFYLKGIYIYKEWELWLGCQSKLSLRKKLLYNESLSARLWVRIEGFLK